MRERLATDIRQPREHRMRAAVSAERFRIGFGGFRVQCRGPVDATMLQHRGRTGAIAGARARGKDYCVSSCVSGSGCASLEDGADGREERSTASTAAGERRGSAFSRRAWKRARMLKRRLTYYRVDAATFGCGARQSEASQMMAVPSRLEVSTWRPSGEKLTEVTSSV